MRKKILINNSLILLAIGDAIVALFSWCLAILVYNLLIPDFPITLQVLKTNKGIITYSSIFYAFFLYFFGILNLVSFEKVFLNKWQLLIGIFFYSIIILLMKFILPDFTLSFKVIFLYIISLFVFTLSYRYVVIKIPQWYEKKNLARFIPPIIVEKMPSIKSYFEEKPSAYFIIAFMILLIICAFLLMFNNKIMNKLAEELAVVAYFSLVIGVGIEFYQTIKSR